MSAILSTPPLANRERQSFYASPVDRKAALRDALNKATDLRMLHYKLIEQNNTQ